jgi:site-specific recombinase XerD
MNDPNDKLALVGAQPLPGAIDRSGASGDVQLVELWLRTKRSPQTQRSYALVASMFLDHLDDQGMNLKSCTVEALMSWFEGVEGKPATRKQRLAAIKSLLSFGQRTGYLTYNVGSAIELPRVPNQLAERLLSELEVQRLFEAARGRTEVLMRVLYYTGARIEEALGLHWENIHSSEQMASLHVITLHGKGGKTRHVTVGDPVFQALCSLITVEHHAPLKLVFVTRSGRPLSQQSARDSLTRVAKRAGLVQRVSPHWLRHAHASHALDRGAAPHVVQATLGHSSLATTTLYAHAKPGASSATFLGEL